MDLVVVPGSLELASSSGGPARIWEPGFVDFVLFAVSFCIAAVGDPFPEPRSRPRFGKLFLRWALIAQRAINFTRSHYGTYSLRNTAGSKPNLKRRTRRASTPGPILHEGPAVSQDGPLGDRARRHHELGGRIHMGGGDWPPSDRTPRGFGRAILSRGAHGCGGPPQEGGMDQT